MEGRLGELSQVLEVRLVEPGPAMEGHAAEPSQVLEGRPVELAGREGGSIVLVRRSVQESAQQLGADGHATQIDSSLFADALEFRVAGVRGLLVGVCEAPGRGGQPDADAVVLSAGVPPDLDGYGADPRPPQGRPGIGLPERPLRLGLLLPAGRLLLAHRRLFSHLRDRRSVTGFSDEGSCRLRPDRHHAKVPGSWEVRGELWTLAT